MIALLFAYLFVFIILGIAITLDKYHIVDDEGSRKFIHISVSNWWILAMFLFDQDTFYLAIIPPFTFIILNYLSYRFNLVKPMERKVKTENDLGTVYYAISLFIIAFFAFYFDITRIGALAILAMGYGDGFSAIIGKAMKSKVIYHKKTLAGLLTVFGFTFIIGLILFPNRWYDIIIIALVASGLELFTKKGLDNLTVPLGVFILGVLLL
jgi:phytol kinase